MEAVKAALNRQFSFHAADRDKMVCRIRGVSGSHLEKALFCGTNGAWLKRHERLERDWLQVSMERGAIGALQWVRGLNVNYVLPLKDPADFRKLMKALPPVPSGPANTTSPSESP